MGLLATIGSLWGPGKTPDELQRESEASDNALAEFEARKAARDQEYLDELYFYGLGDDSQQTALDRRVAIEREHLATQRMDTAEIPASLDAAADEGLNEGAANVTGFVGGVFGVVGKALGSVLKGVPFWLWLVLAAVLFVWLGGGGFLAGKARKALAS
jgi:hypothetical protein